MLAAHVLIIMFGWKNSILEVIEKQPTISIRRSAARTGTSHASLHTALETQHF
jgi:hypothetical protein